MSWHANGTGRFSSPMTARAIGSLLIVVSLGLLYVVFSSDRDVRSLSFLLGFEAVAAFAMGVLALRLSPKRSGDGSDGRSENS